MSSTRFGQGLGDRYLRSRLLVGIERQTIDARIVIASVDTYLPFAEAVNRLHLTENGTKANGGAGGFKVEHS
jgi:hypothetical protein